MFLQTELEHFEHKINKHEYFLKEAALAKANIHLQGKVTEAPEFRQQLEQRVEDYALKVSFDTYRIERNRLFFINLHIGLLISTYLLHYSL